MGQDVVLEVRCLLRPQRPKLDKVVIKPIDGVEPIAAALEAGDIQYIGGNPLAAQLIDRFMEPRSGGRHQAGARLQSVWLNRGASR
ncbi:MAG: hypothetical protein R3D85_12365 [Paracoccaceae bacterium]